MGRCYCHFLRLGTLEKEQPVCSRKATSVLFWLGQGNDAYLITPASVCVKLKFESMCVQTQKEYVLCKATERQLTSKTRV